MTKQNLGASIRQRLLSHARATGADFNQVLTRFALERFLYRIGVSKYAEHFLLKGALLFDLWFDMPLRPTRDADFLGVGPSELPLIESTFKEICSIANDDGIDFRPESVKLSEIRKDANYAGIRVVFMGLLDSARCQVQVDIGFGDAVTPAAEQAVYPVILPDLAKPRLHVYPRYTVVAEKFETLTTMGIANTRMKDFFDLWMLSRHCEFDGRVLSDAVLATFQRRASAIPSERPLGLSEEFALDSRKQTQWAAFLRKNNLEAPGLDVLVPQIAEFLMPVAIAAQRKSVNATLWSEGGPWIATKII